MNHRRKQSLIDWLAHRARTNPTPGVPILPIGTSVRALQKLGIKYLERMKKEILEREKSDARPRTIQKAPTFSGPDGSAIRNLVCAIREKTKRVLGVA